MATRESPVTGQPEDPEQPKIINLKKNIHGLEETWPLCDVTWEVERVASSLGEKGRRTDYRRKLAASVKFYSLKTMGGGIPWRPVVRTPGFHWRGRGLHPRSDLASRGMEEGKKPNQQVVCSF